MWSRIRGLLVAPVFAGDQEKTRRARLVIAVLDFTAIVAGIVALSFLLNARPILGNVVIVLCAVGLIGCMRLAAARGHLTFVSYGLVGLFTVITTAGIAMVGTVRTPGTGVYALIVFVAGFLLDRRAIILVAALDLAAFSALALAENAGLLPRPDYTITISYWISVAATIFVAAVFSYWFRNDISYALRQARQELAERERTERLLRASEERFRAVVENITDVIVMVDSENQVQYVSPAIQQIMGYAPPERNGRSIFELTHPHDRAQVRWLLDQLHRSPHESFQIEIRARQREGAWRWMEVRARNLLNDPAVRAIVLVNRDITQRKQTEAALRESELKFRTVVESSLIGTYIIDDSGRFLYANNEVTQICGYSFDELAHIDIADLIVDQDRAAAIDRYERRLRGEEVPLNYEMSVVRKDGQIRRLEIAAVTIHSLEGRPITIGQMIDITERKQNDEERETLITELERRNAELERFTYTVSHDLKSPLVTIASFVGFIEQDVRAGDTARLANDIRRINEATERMRRLLDDLLELSRVGRLVSPPEAVPFGVIVREALELLYGYLNERGVIVHVAPDLPTIYGDRTRLVEVVQNLLENAAKFPGANATPQVEIGTQERNGEYVFFVRDNGIGIDPAHHQKIFGLFDKLDKQSEGTGIGLALVKRIIEIHGGRIWVESQGIGHGSMFCFTLPMKP